MAGQDKTSLRSWPLSYVLIDEKVPTKTAGDMEGKVFQDKKKQNSPNFESEMRIWPGQESYRS